MFRQRWNLCCSETTTTTKNELKTIKNPIFKLKNNNKNGGKKTIKQTGQ